MASKHEKRTVESILDYMEDLRQSERDVLHETRKRLGGLNTYGEGASMGYLMGLEDLKRWILGDE